MERRLVVVFALTFLVIMLFQPLLKKYGPQPPAKTESPRSAEQTGSAPAQTASTSSTPSTLAPATTAGGSAARTGSAGVSAPVQASAESESVIENEVYRIVFTNRGARVKSWILKKFTDDKGGQLELVNSVAANKYGYPLTLWSYEAALRDKLNSVLYLATSTGTTAPAEI